MRGEPAPHSTQKDKQTQLPGAAGPSSASTVTCAGSGGLSYRPGGAGAPRLLAGPERRGGAAFIHTRVALRVFPGLVGGSGVRGPGIQKGWGWGGRGGAQHHSKGTRSCTSHGKAGPCFQGHSHASCGPGPQGVPSPRSAASERDNPQRERQAVPWARAPCELGAKRTRLSTEHLSGSE